MTAPTGGRLGTGVVGAGPGAPLPEGVSPRPLLPTMPALYQDDLGTERLLGALDQVLAPVLTVLDCLPSYVDPGTAPPDMLAWVGTWLGVALEPDWPPAKRRRVVAAAVQLYGGRGTLAALRTVLETVLDRTDATIEESGRTTTSATPTDELPGDARGWVRVQLPEADDKGRLRAHDVLRDWCPAHLRLEVV